MSAPDLRPKAHLKLGVDFGTVCRRCGARLLDEPVVTVALGRYLRDRLRLYRDVREHAWPLCEPCAELVWPPIFAAARDALAPPRA